jgi:hypothetical protein
MYNLAWQRTGSLPSVAVRTIWTRRGTLRSSDLPIGGRRERPAFAGPAFPVLRAIPVSSGSRRSYRPPYPALLYRMGGKLV